MAMVKEKNKTVENVLKELKCEILKDFEKVCPTDLSFQRIKKDMHDKFDSAYVEVLKANQQG